jgi:hypothetical protein
MMAQDSTGSSRLFDKLKADVNRTPFFAPFLKSSTSEEISFVSDVDRLNRDVIPSIKVTAHPCTTNAVRGPSSFFLALDEFAFYRKQIGSSSDQMYEAASPATMLFKAGGTREGRRESMIFIITSPEKKIGKYYTLFKSAMEEGPTSPVLAFRCSTAEMNPRSDVSFLRQQHKENPDVFRAEYGGEFLDSSDTFTKKESISECVDESRTNTRVFDTSLIGQKYFWGLDLGTKKDATALAISHWVPYHDGGGPVLVYDFIDRMIVGEGKYEFALELPPEDILQWLEEVNRLLPCFQGVTDQYGGSMFVHLLESRGISGLELLHLSGSINSQMYLILKGMIERRRVRFPNEPTFITEMNLLEATYVGKYQIKVEAPHEKDMHDDQADAVAESAFIAHQWAIGDGAREFTDMAGGFDISAVVRQSTLGGASYVDPNTASMSVLRMLDRQSAMQMRSNAVNPWRRR